MQTRLFPSFHSHILQYVNEFPLRLVVFERHAANEKKPRGCNSASTLGICFRPFVFWYIALFASVSSVVFLSLFFMRHCLILLDLFGVHAAVLKGIELSHSTLLSTLMIV